MPTTKLCSCLRDMASRRILSAMRTLALCLLLLVSCSSPKEPEEKRSVLVSVPPLAYFAKALVGKQIAVTTLLPPGRDPHTYEPKPSQVAAARDASLWFRMGEPFEEQIQSALPEGTVTVIDVREGLPLLPSPCRGKHCHHNHGDDPHIWMSARLSQEIVKAMAMALREQFPGQSAQIRKREGELLEELRQLDSQLSEELAPVKGRAYLVSHPAFAYLFQDYGLRQIPIEYEGKEPTPRQLTQVVEEAREAGVDRILVQQQFSERGAVLIAAELNIPTYPVDPLAEDYPRNLRHIALVLVEPADND